MNTPTDEAVKLTASRDLAWARHHLLLLAVVVALALGAVYGLESIVERHDAAKADEMKTILAVQADKVNALSGQLAESEKRADEREARSLALISQLSGAITRRDAALAEQVKQNATLTAEQAAARLAEQTKAGPGQVVAQGDALLVDLPIGRDIISAFDRLSVLQMNLADTQNQLGAEAAIAADAKSATEGQKQLVSALRTQLADQDKACKSEVALVKAKARKGKLKWFGIGYVAGFVSAKVLGL